MHGEELLRYRNLTDAELVGELPAGPDGSVIGRLRTLLALWSERTRTRRQLEQMDDWLLHDIGVSRADVARESLKWFWQP